MGRVGRVGFGGPGRAAGRAGAAAAGLADADLCACGLDFADAGAFRWERSKGASGFAALDAS